VERQDLDDAAAAAAAAPAAAAAGRFCSLLLTSAFQLPQKNKT